MRGLLAPVFLLIAGSVGHAQSFSFNVGGQPIHVDVRGYCAECVSVNVPGYVQYGRPLRYDSEAPYVGRSQRAPRNAQAPKRKPQVAMLRDSLPSTSADRNAAPARQAPVAAPAVSVPAPAVAAPVATPSTIPPSAAAPPAVQPPSASPPAIQPPAIAVTPPPPAPVAPPAIAAAPEIAPAPPPATQPPVPAATRSLPPAPAAQEIAAAAPIPALPIKPETAPPPAEHVATPPAAAPAPDNKPTVIAALPPAKEIERPKPSGTSPLGVWSSSEGQMRVEQCGKNICSYAVGGPHAGKMILRHMRQTSDNRWSGQVTDVRSGQTYAAHMSMRGSNSLNIQGCALGGLVCGGRTLTRAR